jgi:type VI secretion system protein ImpE
MPETQWPWLTTLAAALSEEGERAQALRLEALEQAQATPADHPRKRGDAGV